MAGGWGCPLLTGPVERGVQNRYTGDPEQRGSVWGNRMEALRKSFLEEEVTCNCNLEDSWPRQREEEGTSRAGIPRKASLQVSAEPARSGPVACFMF